jgi:TfoX/Sxy family transcriptional regulator of competence genes
MATPEPTAAFDELAARFAGRPAVDRRTSFRSPGLTVDGRIFAMLVDGELVVKLPAARCAELVEAGAGRPFESGRRRMREWVTITGAPEPVRWGELADEAFAFVRG